MTEEKSYWKITIRGPSIQGVMLREAIIGLKDTKKGSTDKDNQLAKDLAGIKGFARNYEDHVELIIKAKIEQATCILEAIKSIPDSPRSMGIVTFSEEPTLEEIPTPEKLFSEEDFQNFTVKRDGEQKEMVLALQGAGKIFKHSADIQQTVSDQLRARDLQKTSGLLLSIYYEMGYTRDVLASKDTRKISIIALQQAFISPPILENSFVYQQSELFLKLREWESTPIHINGEPERHSLLKRIDGFRDTIAKELEARNIKLS